MVVTNKGQSWCGRWADDEDPNPTMKKKGGCLLVAALSSGARVPGGLLDATRKVRVFFVPQLVCTTSHAKFKTKQELAETTHTPPIALPRTECGTGSSPNGPFYILWDFRIQR